MTIRTLLAFFCAATFLCGNASAGDKPLAGRHGALGLSCAACHETASPAAGDLGDDAKCAQCHLRAKIEAALSRLGAKNPHKNHLGDIGCQICHSGHGASKLYCSECHNNWPAEMK